MGKENKIDYLEEERLKIWERISAIEEKINSNPEAESRQASKKTSEFKNKSEEALKLIKEYENTAKQSYDEIVALKEKVDYINKQYGVISDNEKNIEALESIFEDFANLQRKINSLSELLTNGEETFDKINLLLKNANDKTTNIKKLYSEIMGYDTPKEDGEEVFVIGLKGKLEESYNEIEKKVDSLQNQLDFIVIDSDKNFKSKISEFEKTFQGVNNKIKSLLPDALTAGLCSAYSTKRMNEEKEENRQTRLFSIAILGMIIVSLIPFGVSIHMLVVDKVTLGDVLMKLPRMVPAILPLYIPVLWLAYSSGKRRNLSKRLIEEYTHKEVLSKTFEGLSEQISKIEDDGISSDLRNRLLYNLLEVTSENPGKLISDYNKSDHPFMEVLDNSVKLANSMEKFSKVPGLSKLISFWGKRADKMLENTTKKIESELDSIIENEKK